jgi:pimeloyl-ACP methyl ester carboxylesterase
VIKSVHYRNGNTLAYADYGDLTGVPVLIQHGMIASIKDEHLFDRLIETGARLISIARPGYGESSPYVMKNIAEWGDIVATLVNELGLAQFDVLGISSGAPYSYAIGYKFPDRARNIFILSGIPALYDENVVSFWPYPVNKNASLAEMQKLAYELFFSHLSADDLEQDDVKDSLMNNCFGVGQDLRIRGMEWGFRLSEVKQRVMMQHARADNLITAELTARLLPDCQLKIQENGVHFSQEVLDDFIDSVMAGYYKKGKP